MPSEPSAERTIDERIRKLAADGHRARVGIAPRLLKRLRKNARQIARAHRLLSERVARRESVPPESEWLLDNYYIIEEVIRLIRDHLPSSFYRELPVMQHSPHAGLPRVYPLARAIVGCGETALSEREIRQAVEDYQQTTALGIGELWAVPIMLRIAVIELLRSLVDDMLKALSDAGHAKRDVARGRCHDRPSDAHKAAVWEIYREQVTHAPAVEAWVGEHLADPHLVLHREFSRQAANQVSIGNAVTTLRLLNVIDWRAFFEATSLVEAMLRQDPAGVYMRQEFATRDRCRRAVELLARRSRRPEVDVARAAIASASRHHPPHPVARDLIGEGRPRFARILGERRFTVRRLRDWFRNRPGLLFFGLLAGFALAVAAGPLALLAATDWWIALPAIVATLLVASEVGVGLTNVVVRKMLVPRVLPKLEFREGIPTDCATFVAIPTLIARPEQAPGLAERLEQHYLSNPDPSLFFALLIDFIDADREVLPTDGECQAQLEREIARLNAAYCPAAAPRFFLFYRRRLWNPSENCWMGWERKRGKLEEFNRLLRGAKETSYRIEAEAIPKLPRVRYVLTLDADTVLPRDAASQMIATLAHPLNNPRPSADGRRVASGYTILQPKVSFLYRTGFRSWFARVFAGSAGVDPYSSASSDTFMDLFGRGSFTGKGLYEVDAFLATAGHAFPENAILSHDLIESAYARCALATDIEVFDEFPAKYHAYARRDHRWIRGDWQLLPWLMPRVPTPHDGRLPNVLPLHERWKIFDNLRRSLVPVAALTLLALSWFALPGSPLGWMVLALAPLLLPSLILGFETVVHLPRKTARRALPSRLRYEFLNTLGQAGLQLVFLVDQARLAVDAIARTLYRLTISRRRFLEWETAAASEARLGHGFSQFVLTMWPALAIAGTLLIFAFAFAPHSLVVAIPLGLLWLASPLVAWAVSRPRVPVEVALTPREDAELRRIARLTWTFFETYVGEADHWLPPDNFQEAPLGLVAHRTSPTNIGLYLLAVQAAHDFEYITADELLDRLGKAFNSLDKLERHRGHFYNWYDTSNLATLHPAYVSTVDSGNLLACLMALKQGLLERPESERSAERIALARRSEVMAAGMSFQFLYNAERELFSIGYNAATQRLDANHYDLLASEACIASFLAVARGEVPRKHWFRLGRLVTTAAGHTGLVSWGGTMFEYLMPRLLLPTSSGVLLDQAQKTAVARQIEHGRETERPWGMSESGFALVDAAQVYQYQSFGVPGLGLKRGLERDRVVAPYATLMAIDIDAAAAVANLDALREFGAEGSLGFYEALDFTPERATVHGEPSIVKSYMAHHQGMGFLAIANRLMNGRFRERLAREPAVRAAQLLLDERVPAAAPLLDPDGPAQDSMRELGTPEYPLRRRITTPHTPMPRIHLLSNGHYTAMVTNAGGGYSRCGALDITRWRADALADNDGQFLYLRDRRSGAVWSATHQPTSREADQYEAAFSIDKAEFRRLDGEIETRMEVIVVPGQNLEIRRLTITNLGTRPRMLDATSYAEIVLSTHAADAAHPAFGKLFVETEWLPNSRTLLFQRRPRSADQKPLFAFHGLTTEVAGTVSYESSREEFLGRRRDARNPQALDPSVANLGGSTGPVLDPIASIRLSFILKPRESAVLSFTTGSAVDRAEAVTMAENYFRLAAIVHAFELAWAHARIELQGSRWKADDVPLYQRLAGHLHYPTGPLRSDGTVLASNRFGQSALWAFGISGDLPILLLRLHSAGGMPAVRQLLQAHSYWQSKAFAVDLVVMLENAGGYHDELHDEVINQVRQEGLGESMNRPAGIFVRKGFQMTEPDRTLLLAAARVVLDDRLGPVAVQADLTAAPRNLPARRTPPVPATRFQSLPQIKDLQLENECGGFSADGREYVLPDGRTPPLPWSNVIANERGGFLVTDSGSGFAWAGNSQSFRLTPWSNDPVTDPFGEAIYLHDEDAGSVWCPTPGPIFTAGQVRVRHGQGYSSFERNAEEIRSELTVFVPLEDPVKISRLTLKNTSHRIRRIEIVYHVDWVLGTHREATMAHVVTRVDTDTGAVLAGNRFHPDFPQHIAFVDCDLRPRTVTGDRGEFLGRNRTMANPAALDRSAFSGQCGAGLDPGASLRGSITLAPGEERTIVLLLGCGADPGEARRMIRQYRAVPATRAELQKVREHWDRLCRGVQVRTPDAALNLLMNRWLLYQTVACRLWGRSAFSQSGGAYGFRDQLQDVCALVHTRPDLVRAHLLRAARRQFVEGDVQHWWHEPAGNGVRTRFSDDFLWLPYALAVYVEATGDEGVLGEVVPFIEAPPLAPDQHEVYGIPTISEQTGTLYEHGRRALDFGWKLGAHGLPLMGTGDWNDGMNTVGSEGRGESVWVGWFQIVVLEMFAGLADRTDDEDIASRCRMHAQQLHEALETHAWDGAWYRRAYFDDGTPLGSATNDECQIDSLAQSWAVIAGGNAGRCELAMDAVRDRLLRPDPRLILLFDPPFDDGPQRPGYIRGYVPGVRENGGQYTHAAAWVVKALARLGRGTAAGAALELLTPARMPMATYRGEPYAIPGDVYSAKTHVGRVGWTWYTGSSAWLYRVVLDDVLGLTRRGDRLHFRPCLPAAWPMCEVVYRFGATEYRIQILNPQGLETGAVTVSLDDTPIEGGGVPLVDDGNAHKVMVRIGIGLPRTENRHSRWEHSSAKDAIIA